MTNRVFALILCFVMCMSLFPVSAFAEEDIAEEAVEEAISLPQTEENDSGQPIAAFTDETEEVAPVGDGALDVPEDDAEIAESVILSDSEESLELANPSVGEADSSPCIGEPEETVILRSESDEESQLPAAEDEILRSAQDDMDDPFVAAEADEVQGIVASGACGDNLTWTLDDQGTLTISGIGAMWNYGREDDGVPWPVKQVKNIVIENGVSSLGKYTCYACNAESITIPLSLTSIPYECFYFCSISDVYFLGTPMQKRALESGWEFVGPPGYGVDPIWHYAGAEEGWDYCGDEVFWQFDGNSGTLTIKGTGSMWDYYEIIPKQERLTNTPWDERRGDVNAIVIDGSNITLGSYVFYGFSSLSEISVPEGVVSIGQYAFSNCASLESVIFSDSLTGISDYAFSNCSDLHNVVFSDSITSIGAGAFINCSKIEELSLPEHLTTINNSSFAGCSNLQAISFNNKLTTIGDSAFSGCGRLIEISLSDSLAFIGSKAFFDCSRMISIAIPAGLQQIGAGAFSDCMSLEMVYFGGSAEEKNERFGKGWITTGNGDLFRAIWFYDGTRPGWNQIDGKWYYYNADGTVKTGWLKSGSSWFYMGTDGAMQTGWVKVSGTWYYFKSNGAMVTGWQQINGTWYYFQSSGAMKTGWLKSGSSWYYLKNSGAMAVGWQKVGSTWYYFQSSGAMKTGWLKDGGKWYYLDTSGAMLANTSRNISGKVYYFNASGVCTNP